MGANNCNKNLDISEAGQRIEATIGRLWRLTPDATVILATITPNGKGGAFEANVVAVNEQSRALYQALQSRGKRIILAEFHDGSGFLHYPADFHDIGHPNDKGYIKMANIWFKAIQQAVAAGFIQPL